MGTKYNFTCKSCGYRVESFAKLDVGMIVIVEPYICNDCKELMDVLIWFKNYSDEYPDYQANKYNWINL